MCGAWVNDLRCFPGLRQQGGRYPTITQLQADYACPACMANVRTRMLNGELHVICDGPEAHDIIALGRVIAKRKRDWIIAQQEADAVEVMDRYATVLGGETMSRLKDRDRTRPRRLVRLGIIRLGFKKKTTKKRDDGSSYEIEYPVQADHFVLTDAPEIATVYGEEPRELDVYLPFPDPERNFDAAYTVWAGGILLCRGDGDFVDYATPHKIVTTKKGTSVRNAPGDTLVSSGVAQVAFTWNGEEFNAGDHVPCAGASKDLYPHCAACSVSAILKVIMSKPELFRLGYFQIATGSVRNYDTILGTMELIHSQSGNLTGIPFKLRLVLEPTTYVEDGLRRKTEKWFLQLEPDPEYMRSLLIRQAANLLKQGESIRRLAAPEEPFDEWDETAPPPIANEVIDIESGEILGDEDEADAQIAWARNVTTTRGTPYEGLNLDQLQWILDNAEKKADADQIKAARILRDALAAEMQEANEAESDG